MAFHSKRPRHDGRNTATHPTIDLEVDSLTWGGKGVGRHEGKVIFVPKSAPGDHLLVRLDRVKASYAEGHIQAVLSPSVHRVDPKCKFFSHCGGCQWLSVSYERQLQEKEAILRSALRHHLNDCQVDPIVASDPPRGYRHRGEFHVKPSGGGIKIGFYQEESHQLVNLDVCLLFDGAFNGVYHRLRAALQDKAEARCIGRIVLARSESEEHYAVLVVVESGTREQDAAAIASVLQGLSLGGFLVARAGPAEQVLVRGGNPRVRFELPSEESRNGALGVEADIRAFTQAHYALNRKMVAAALQWLGLARHERLLDLYAGVGNFSLPVAAACREVVAVEANPFAHEDAKANAGRNGLLNLRHLPGEALPWTTKLAAASEPFDAVLLDPPRTGARGLAEPLSYLGPRRILYVSCNLPSLDRDLQDFAASGYRPIRIQPWDLFPQTYGVETLCLLTKQG